MRLINGWKYGDSPVVSCLYSIKTNLNMNEMKETVVCKLFKKLNVIKTAP